MQIIKFICKNKNGQTGTKYIYKINKINTYRYIILNKFDNGLKNEII